MLLKDYIRMIKQKYVKPKTIDYIDEIAIYTYKGEVYKVVIRYYESLMKKLRKLGIEHYIQILTDIPRTKINDELISKCTKYDNLTTVYRSRTQISTVMSGEERTVSTNLV